MSAFLGMLIRVFILGGFIKLMLKWEHPIFWAFLYTLVLVPLTLLGEPSRHRLIFMTGAILVGTSLFLWILNDIVEEGSPLWWLVLVLGIIASMLPSWL